MLRLCVGLRRKTFPVEMGGQQLGRTGHVRDKRGFRARHPEGILPDLAGEGAALWAMRAR